MKKITGGFLFVSAAFGLAACGGATNTNVMVNGNKVANNSAVVINSNTNSLTNSMSNSGNGNSMSNTTSSVSDDDKKFMNDAAQGGMTEVKLGELAEQKGANADVKAFGKKMTEDHGKAGDDLKAIASKKGVTLPADMNSDQKAAYDKLSKLSGAEFDKEYAAEMVKDHEKDSAAFKKQSEDAKDSELKSFAGKYSPIVDSHLKMIKDIQGKMK